VLRAGTVRQEGQRDDGGGGGRARGGTPAQIPMAVARSLATVKTSLRIASVAG
jgi:hypothetical protein